jgi:hypothetical protein
MNQTEVNSLSTDAILSVGLSTHLSTPLGEPLVVPKFLRASTFEEILSFFNQMPTNLKDFDYRCYNAVYNSRFTDEQIQRLFIQLHMKHVKMNHELFFQVAKNQEYTLLKWMELSQSEKCPSEIVDVITDLNVLKYFLQLGYKPSSWAPINQFERGNNEDFDQRLELLLNYPSIIDDYEGLQWLFIDDYSDKHLPIIAKIVERYPDWVDTEHGWNYKYTILQNNNENEDNIIYLNYKLMTSWELYDDYDKDEEDEVEDDDNYTELDELLSTITPNADTVIICGKNSCLPYHVIKKVFEKCEFSNTEMKRAFTQFRKDIDETNSSSVKEDLDSLLAIADPSLSKKKRRKNK